MQIVNNAKIRFNKKIPEDAIKKLNQIIDAEDGTIYFAQEPNYTYLEIEECWGDLCDTLNDLVEALKPYGISPEEGEFNRYYGDYDGYDVFTGERFESMDDESYGAYSVSVSYMISRLEKLGYTVIPPEGSAT